MERLRRVHRAAAQLTGGFAKTDHISQYIRKVLHWLPLPQRISYRLAFLVWRCLSVRPTVFSAERGISQHIRRGIRLFPAGNSADSTFFIRTAIVSQKITSK